MLSNCARFVVIVWVFVVFILTQSYTASLTSLLTVQQLQPTVIDVNELIKNGEYVGYQEDSFVLGILKEMKFDTSKLRQYNSPYQCDELLSKGSANGGIAAAFDEIPYMKLFLTEYCSKYIAVPLIYKTDGFGFAFQRGSPLVADVSRAILNVREGGKMKEIENAWLGKDSNCLDSNPQVPSNSLSLASFWGLFLIAGVASSLAIIISVCMFLYKERQQILMHFGSEGSLGRRIRHTLRIFDRKDLSSHIFRKRAFEDKSEPPPNTNCPPSPSNHSTHEECHLAFLGDPGTPCREYANLSPNDQVSQPEALIEIIVLPNQESHE